MEYATLKHIRTPPAERAVDDDLFGHQHLTIIEPQSGRWSRDLRELWAYRELLWVLAARDVQVRYKQTLLGAGWAILRPLLTTMVFAVIFGRLAKMPSDGVAYTIFVYSALVPWTFFSSALSAAGASVLASANLIGKIYFPRTIVPLSSLGSALVDLAVSSVVLVPMLVYFGVAPTWRLVVAPLLLVALAALALGCGMLVAAWTIAFRDLQHLMPFAMQTWMFVTPVVYPASLFPDAWRWFLLLNPAAGLVTGLRSSFLGRPFDSLSLATSLLSSVALLALGLAEFRRAQRRFADLL